MLHLIFLKFWTKSLRISALDPNELELGPQKPLEYSCAKTMFSGLSSPPAKY